MTAIPPGEQLTAIRTTTVPLVTRWDQGSAPWLQGELANGPTYVLEFEDAAVSVRLTEAQVRGLGARILTATLASDDDLEAMTAADDDR